MFPDPLYFSVSVFARILSLSCCYIAHFLAISATLSTTDLLDNRNKTEEHGEVLEPTRSINLSSIP